MTAQATAIRVSFLVLALFAATFPACSGSGGSGGLPEEMRAPIPGSVLGNWSIEGNSIIVIKDTGDPHEIRDGNVIRISSRGVEVLADAFIQPGGIREQLRLGQRYDLATNAAGNRFSCSLITEPGFVRGELVELECDGVLAGDRLNVTYKVVRREGGIETERDELTFQCVPGTDVDTRQDGRWQIGETFVILRDNTGLLKDFNLQGDLVIENGQVTQLFGEPFLAATYQKRWGMVRPGMYEKVETGRVECSVWLLPTGLRVPPWGPTHTFFFLDIVRSGSRLTGRVRAVQAYGMWAPASVTDIDLTYRRSM